MIEATITNNTRSYFTRFLSPKQKRIHTSADEDRDWARSITRECGKCKVHLPRSHFGYNTSSSWPFDKSGYLLRRPECIPCQRKSNDTKKLAEKDAKQRGLPIKAPPGTPCQLCSKTDSIVFDHSHTLCRFRGWLCNSCNRSMGVLGDEPEEVIKAVEYLCGGDTPRFRTILETCLKNLNEQ